MIPKMLEGLVQIPGQNHCMISYCILWNVGDNGYMSSFTQQIGGGLGRHHHMFEQLSKKQILYIHIYSKGLNIYYKRSI